MFATVNEAPAKRRMPRGAKLNANIASAGLVTHEKAPLPAIKEFKGGGHTGVMTGGIVATSMVFSCCSVFLVHAREGHRDSQGNQIPAYINGDIVDRAEFEAAQAQRHDTKRLRRAVEPDR